MVLLEQRAGVSVLRTNVCQMPGHHPREAGGSQIISRNLSCQTSKAQPEWSCGVEGMAQATEHWMLSVQVVLLVEIRCDISLRLRTLCWNVLGQAGMGMGEGEKNNPE